MSSPKKNDDSKIAQISTLKPIKDAHMKTTTPRDIQEQCDALIATASVDKEISINILKLYNSMETIYAQLQFEKTCEIEALKNEVRILGMSQTTSSAVSEVVKENNQLKDAMKVLREECLQAITSLREEVYRMIAGMRKECDEMKQLSESLEGRFLALSTKRR